MRAEALFIWHGTQIHNTHQHPRTRTRDSDTMSTHSECDMDTDTDTFVFVGQVEAWLAGKGGLPVGVAVMCDVTQIYVVRLYLQLSKVFYSLFFIFVIRIFLVGPGTIPTPWAPVNAGPPGPLGSADTNGSMVDSKNLDVGDMSDVSNEQVFKMQL